MTAPGFLRLEFDEISKIFESDELVLDEYTVFTSLVGWMVDEASARSKYVNGILDLIRFELIPPSQLAGIRNFPFLKDNEAFKSKLLDAFAYHSLDPSDEARKAFHVRPRVLCRVIFEATGSIEEFVVPSDGIYRIQAFGAKAADGDFGSGGRGASIRASFQLKKGDRLEILCGSMSTQSSKGDSGGGGGTFVSINGRLNPLIVAGGGGGTRGTPEDEDGSDASLGPNGMDGIGKVHSAGGRDGNGGFGLLTFGGGGGGYFSDATGDGAGSAMMDAGGRAFVSGGFAYNHGGFGGGGGVGDRGGGGGGGYSGGGAGKGGGGGGSYVREDGFNVTRSADHCGPGRLIIERIN